jgi:1-acyl-sn-glycerol-3-phosphate acyltransferase
MIRSLAFNLFFYVFTLLTAIVGIVLVPIPTPVVLRTLLHWWARSVVWAARGIGGMRVEIRGRANLPAHGPALLANKHHSESDGIFLAALIPGIAFVAMQELFRYPLIGAILYRLQMIRVDTCGGGKERERYRSGIYDLYRDLGLPVTPVATSLGLLWNRRDWRKKAGRCAIEFLPAIETGLDKQTFMRRLEETIETASDRLIAEFSGRPYAPSQLVLRSQGQTGIGQPVTAPRAAL